MKAIRSISRNWKAVALSAVAIAMPTMTQADTPIPHVARYDLEVERVYLPGVVGTSGGDYVYRIEKRCGSWTILARLTFTMHLEDGRDAFLETTIGNEESVEGDQLRFKAETALGGTTLLRLIGGADDGVVTFKVPDDQPDIALPADTLFPVA